MLILTGLAWLLTLARAEEAETTLIPPSEPAWVQTAYPIKGLSMWTPDPEDTGHLFGLPDAAGVPSMASGSIRVSLRVATPPSDTLKFSVCRCRVRAYTWHAKKAWNGKEEVVGEERLLSLSAENEGLCLQQCEGEQFGEAAEYGEEKAIRIDGSSPATYWFIDRSGRAVDLIVSREKYSVDSTGRVTGVKNCFINSTICRTSDATIVPKPSAAESTRCPMTISDPEICQVYISEATVRYVCPSYEGSFTRDYYDLPKCEERSFSAYSTVQSVVMLIEVKDDAYALSPTEYNIIHSLRKTRLDDMPKLGDVAPSQILRTFGSFTRSTELRILQLEALVVYASTNLQTAARAADRNHRGSFIAELHPGAPALFGYGPGYLFVRRLVKVTSGAFAQSSHFDRWPVKWEWKGEARYSFLDLNTLVLEDTASVSTIGGPMLLRTNSTSACDLRMACHTRYPLFLGSSGSFLGKLEYDASIKVQSYQSADLLALKYTWAEERVHLNKRTGEEKSVSDSLASEIGGASTRLGLWAMWGALPVYKWFGVAISVGSMATSIWFYFGFFIKIKDAVFCVKKKVADRRNARRARSADIVESDEEAPAIRRPLAIMAPPRYHS